MYSDFARGRCHRNRAAGGPNPPESSSLVLVGFGRDGGMAEGGTGGGVSIDLTGSSLGFSGVLFLLSTTGGSSKIKSIQGRVSAKFIYFYIKTLFFFYLYYNIFWIHICNYGKCSKISYTSFSEKMAYANSADLDQTTPDQDQHCLPFH